MQPEYHYTVASESDLNELLTGREAGLALQWSKWSSPPHVSAGETGVLWKRERPRDPLQPMALIVHEKDFRRLCGRVAQLRGDLSPLTAWCHLLTPALFESLQELGREPELGGLQAAWTGLAVAEAMLLAEVPLTNVRVSGCLATLSFAIARAMGLWHRIPEAEMITRFDAANRLFRNASSVQRTENRINKVRSALLPIWTSLMMLVDFDAARIPNDLRPVVSALRELLEVRSDWQAADISRSQRDGEEARRLAWPLLEYVPEAGPFRDFAELAPEARLKLFDKLVDGLNNVQSNGESPRRNALALLAGYLATVAAGGSPSLALAEGNAQRWPEITAWAYVTGGIGEKVVWTSSFEGLGRLVARELMRPFRLDEPPSCDFALDEATVLVDSKLRDPLVHLRIKQARIVSVAVLPGVNISVPVGEPALQEPMKTDAAQVVRQSAPSVGNPIAYLAEALWPFFRRRIDDHVESLLREDAEWRGPDVQRGRGKRKSGPQAELPLANPKK